MIEASWVIPLVHFGHVGAKMVEDRGKIATRWVIETVVSIVLSGWWVIETVVSTISNAWCAIETVI